MNVFQKRWFNARPRTELIKYIDQHLQLNLDNITGFHTHSSDDKDVIYKMAVASGLIACLMFVKYACVGDNLRKPWFARRAIKQILDLNEFKSYSEEVVTWLNVQPPNLNYSALVYTNTIIKFLTTMEFRNDT